MTTLKPFPRAMYHSDILYCTVVPAFKNVAVGMG
jgi:hypothetical protein